MDPNNKDFTKEELELAAYAKALSHPARIRILKILNDLNACICGDIVDLLPLSQSTVSQHLNELKKVGLIKGEVDGPKSCYCIDVKKMEKVNKEIDKLFSIICKC